MRPRTLPAAAAASVLALLLGSGAVSAQAVEQSGRPRHRPTITIHAYAFTVPKQVTPGVTVRVINQDSVAHTVTSKTSDFDVAAPPQETVTFVAPDDAGTYAFYCRIHHSMKAKLVVK